MNAVRMMPTGQPRCAASPALTPATADTRGRRSTGRVGSKRLVGDHDTPGLALPHGMSRDRPVFSNSAGMAMTSSNHRVPTRAEGACADQGGSGWSSIAAIHPEPGRWNHDRYDHASCRRPRPPDASRRSRRRQRFFAWVRGLGIVRSQGGSAGSRAGSRRAWASIR